MTNSCRTVLLVIFLMNSLAILTAGTAQALCFKNYGSHWPRRVLINFASELRMSLTGGKAESYTSISMSKRITK